MKEFDWIVEAPMYRYFEPDTVYYFTEGGKTVGDIIGNIDPRHMLGKEKSLVDWLIWADEGNTGTGELKYFLFDEDMKIYGWCDETSLKDCKEFHYPESIYNYVSIDDFF